MREIILETETTGLSHEFGDRIIEIACIEIIDNHIAGKKYHQYINPEREIDKDAVDLQKFIAEFFEDKLVFKEIYNEFLGFIDGSTLVAHNRVIGA